VILYKASIDTILISILWKKMQHKVLVNYLFWAKLQPHERQVKKVVGGGFGGWKSYRFTATRIYTVCDAILHSSFCEQRPLLQSFL
jgi:hypothetical protein